MTPHPFTSASAAETAYWLLPMVLPLVAAFLHAVPACRGAMARLSPWAALPGVVVALTAHAGDGVSMPGVFLGLHLGLTGITRVFLLFTSVLWLVAGVYAVFHHRSDPRRHVFFLFYLLSMAGNIGLLLTRDAASFFAAFALMSFAAYGLVVHSGTPKAHEAGRVYIILVVLGEILLFPALAMAAGHADSLLLTDMAARLPDAPHRNIIMALLLLGFGIKAGALPLHVWLPLAHPAAPVPASAVLSGCMIKAGLLGWMSFLPLGLLAMPGWGVGLAAAGLAAAVFGLVAGLLQSEPKALLAYSSIGKMGWMTVAVGVGLAVPESWPSVSVAVCVYALHHAWTKGALFLGVGVSHLPRSRWGVVAFWVGLLLPVLAFAGVSGTGGAAAKAALKDVLYYLPGSWASLMQQAMWWTGGLGALLLARFVYLVKPGPVHEASDRSVVGCAAAWSVAILMVVAVPFLAPLVGLKVSLAKGFTAAGLWSSVWPLLLACALAVVLWRKAVLPSWRMPPGDMLFAYRRAWPPLVALAHMRLFHILTRKHGSAVALLRQRSWGAPLWALLWAGERGLRRWPVVSCMLLALLLIITGLCVWRPGP